jgi:hypothetical protein
VPVLFVSREQSESNNPVDGGRGRERRAGRTRECR